jgi:hypothetical protein
VLMTMAAAAVLVMVAAEECEERAKGETKEEAMKQKRQRQGEKQFFSNYFTRLVKLHTFSGSRKMRKYIVGKMMILTRN